MDFFTIVKEESLYGKLLFTNSRFELDLVDPGFAQGGVRVKAVLDEKHFWIFASFYKIRRDPGASLSSRSAMSKNIKYTGDM